jgi:hypothetical protein
MTRRELLLASSGLLLMPRVARSAEPPQLPPPKVSVRDPVLLGYDLPIPPLPQVQATIGERTPTPAEAADILSIRRLQTTYGQLHEHGTADEIAALFAPDAEVYCLYLGSRGFRGRQQIRDWYAAWLVKYAESGLYYRHRPLNQVVDLAGDRAVISAILGAEGAPRAKPVWDQCWGRYIAEVERREGGWMFTRKWIIIHMATQTGRLPAIAEG